MERMKPENMDPMPLREASPRIGTLMIRFAGLLLVAVALLALLYSR